MDSESSRYEKLESMLHNGSSEPCNLPLEYLRNITNNFSDERLLGEGGFGKVYKVRLNQTHRSFEYELPVYAETHARINKRV